jgi:hypothetical protein
MRAELDDRLLALVVTTTDLRRAAGQAFHHLWLSLARARDGGFAAAVRRASHGAASSLERVEARLRRLGAPSRDERLRRLSAAALDRLASDLEAGEGRLVPFARWLERHLAEVSRLLRDDPGPRRVLDADLARDLRLAFGALARTRGDALPARLREARDALLARP